MAGLLKPTTFTYYLIFQAPSIDPVNSNGNTTVPSISKVSPSNAKNVTITQTSPVRTRRSHYHHRLVGSVLYLSLLNFTSNEVPS